MPDKITGEMSFLDHLEELRWAILKSVLAILVGMVVCFVFSEHILNFLVEPTRLESLNIELQSFKPAGMFTIRINVSLVVGLAVALPYVLFQLWHFVSPGLLDNEKKYIPVVIFFSCILFGLGGAFAFYVLIPVMVQFFIDIYIPGVKAIWDIGFYIGLVNKMVLLMGIVFQMPMVVGFLTWIRILSYDFLKNSWRYAMVIIFIAAAVITPTGDPYTQTLVAIPLVILFFISLGISRLIGGRREPEPEEEETPAEEQAFEQPETPDTPTISRGAMPYSGPETGMGYWPEEDDEFIYDYEDEFEHDAESGDADKNDTGEDQEVAESTETTSEEPQDAAPQTDAENAESDPADDQEEDSTDATEAEDQKESPSGDDEAPKKPDDDEKKPPSP